MDTRGTAALKQSVTLADVRAAAVRLKGIAHRTPVLTSRTLDARTGAHVFLKCENFQRMGAFKFRGAYNRIVQLNDQARRSGVVAFSSGNHAQGVALASSLLGVPAVIVMPSDAPKSKVAATQEYGAEVIFYDRRKSHRAEIAQRICDERGATLVPPFDDAHVIAGQGTAALEVVEDVPGVEVMVTPVGGGGLLSGSAVAARALDSHIDLYGVEPQAGDDFARSLREGRRVHIEVPDTIADGLQTQSPGELTFELVQALAQGIVTVSDADLRRAMQFAFERMKIVIEPSGAAPLAALLAGKMDVRGKRVALIVSGGNIDSDRFRTLLGH